MAGTTLTPTSLPSAGKSSPQATSDGSFLAKCSMSSSTREPPTARPRAFTKVRTMPPPITSLSTLSSMDSITGILVLTLAPPTIAHIGRTWLSTAPARQSSSFFSRMTNSASCAAPSLAGHGGGPRAPPRRAPRSLPAKMATAFGKPPIPMPPNQLPQPGALARGRGCWGLEPKWLRVRNCKIDWSALSARPCQPACSRLTLGPPALSPAPA